MDLIEIGTKIASASGPVMLAVALIAGYFKKWVWGWQLTECQQRCAAEVLKAEVRENEWKAIAKEGTFTASRAVSALKEGR